MGTMLSKVLRDVGEKLMAYRCPACNTAHMLNTDRTFTGVPCWDMVGDPEKPTFHPSVNYRKDGPGRCHSWVKEGVITYLDDCQHDFRNKVVPIPNWNDHHRDSVKGVRVYPDILGNLPGFEKPGRYARVAPVEGVPRWMFVTPDGMTCSLDMSKHTVVEHDNGSISVTPKIITPTWRGFLTEGFFISE